MGLAEWLDAFCHLHAGAKAGTLPREDWARYRAARDELARAVLAAQSLTIRAGQLPRRALRVARALQVNLTFKTHEDRATTLDVSSGGFSALCGVTPRAGEECGVALRIGGGAVVHGGARVVEVKPGEGAARVGFEFVEIRDEDQELLELLVYDAVLDGLRPAGAERR